MPDNDQQTKTRLAKFAPKNAQSKAEAKPAWFARPSVVFIGLGLVATIAIISWLGLFRSGDDIRLDIKEIAVNDEGNVELTGVRYRGRLESGDNFEIIADRANEDKDGSGQISLNQPTASMHFDDGSTTSATANSGIFDQTTSQVDLSGSVILTDYNRNITLQTELLYADFSTGDMRSETPVEVRDPSSIITSNAMDSTQNGQRIRFIGDARMILNNIVAFE